MCRFLNNLIYKLDSNWKCGLIGRNGYGKTTFLKILLNQVSYTGKVETTVPFTYFPYPAVDDRRITDELVRDWNPSVAIWQVEQEMASLKLPTECLQQPYYKVKYLAVEKLQLAYNQRLINRPVSFELEAGDCLFLSGPNGAGKSSLLRAILSEKTGQLSDDGLSWKGRIDVGTQMELSYLPQNIRLPAGRLDNYFVSQGLDVTCCMTLLRKLGFRRSWFETDMADYSYGQKKKVLLAKELCRPATLYLWDEPLNYLDVLSCVQLEGVILEMKPTMLIIEHDRRFVERLATKRVVIT